MSERFEINVNVNEGGKTPTKNPQNTTSTENKSEKLTMDQAETQLAEKQVNNTSTTAQPSSGLTNTLAVGAAALSVVKVASDVANFAADYAGTSYSIRGADYKAAKLQHKMDQVNAGVGLAGATIAGATAGAAVGSIIPGAGTAAGAGIGAAIGAITYTVKTAYNIATDNRDFIKELQVSKVESDYYSQRVRQNISDRR